MTVCGRVFSPFRICATGRWSGAHVNGVLDRHGELELSRFIGELIRTLMSELMEDVLVQTRANLQAASPASAAALRGRGRAMAAFSPALLERLKALKRFQMERMYRHPRVANSMNRAQAVVTDLYEGFVADPDLLPPDWAEGRARRGARDRGAGLYRRNDGPFCPGRICPGFPHRNPALETGDLTRYRC